MIPHSRPNLEAADFNYIREILRTSQVSQGHYVQELEETFCRVMETRYACAVSSGTAALHLVLLALGVNPGDEVVAPSYTCASVLHAIHYIGAKPVLVDIDAATLNPTAEIIRRNITRRTKAVIVTHTFGFPAPMDDLMRLGPPVIEDCAHALGASFKGKPVGSLGTASVFSLYSTKVICAGEGGVVCTNDASIANRIRDLNRPDERIDYRVRYNYKMSDLTAGLALGQMSRLSSLLARRRAIARRYREAFREADVTFQKALPHAQPTFYRFVLRNRRAGRIIREARNLDIGCDRPVFRPLHRYLKHDGRKDLSGTEAVWQSTVSVPLYPDLTEGEVRRIIRGVQHVLAKWATASGTTRKR